MSQYFVYPFAEQGHFTAVHNFVFRRIMPLVSPNAFKVLCFIISETIGYGRPSRGLSYEDIKAGTGIGNDTTVSNALTELLDEEKFGRPLILREHASVKGKSRREKTRYALNLKARLALQKSERENTENTARAPVSRTPENGEREKVRTPKIGASRTPENGVRKQASNGLPIENAGGARSNQQSNEESNSLSPHAQNEIAIEFAENETDENAPSLPPKANVDHRSPFVEGEPDSRFESPHFLALASEEVCDLDLDIIDWKTKSVAAMIAAQLATKYTAEQILEAGRRWDLPTKPHPRQLPSRIKALLSQPKPTNPDANSSENSNATSQRTIAPKYESAAERRARDLAQSLDEFEQRDAALAEKKRLLAELESRDGRENSGFAPRD